MSLGHPVTPQARKLGIKPGMAVALDSAPEGWGLTDPPPGLKLLDGGRAEPVDVVIAFFRRSADLAERLPALARRIFPAGALWVAWPRRAAGHRSDLTDTGIRACALPLGVVDVKVAAIDDDWSALKLVWRVENQGRG
ncbi:MAG TPA: DUF3052 family protein [Actinomycetota bacterium]|nr:DUF3052 family protein [Actinomycetota bacterium]